MPELDTRSSVFLRFVDDNLDKLYSAAYRYTRNADDAEDLTQETLMRAWARLDPARTQPELRAWIWKILVNLWLDQRRHRAALKLVSDDASGLPEPGRSSTTEHEAVRHFTRAEVREAIDALPEHYRLPVMLADIDGFSYEEVAKQLEIPVGTVTSRIGRGRLALRRMLWRTAAAEGIETDRVCREAASLLAVYCRGEASPAETAFVDSHLRDCITCQEAERAEHHLVSVLREYSCHLVAPSPLRSLAYRLPEARVGA